MNKAAGHKILIVDDDPFAIETIVCHLMHKENKYTLFTANSGALAIKIAKEKLPDLIIMDWDMPEMDGIDTIKTLKGDETTRNIPVIMATGVMMTSSDLSTALIAGAVDFIRKPIDKVELQARVQSMLILSDSFKEIQELNATREKVFSIIAHDLIDSIGNIKSMIHFLCEEDIFDESIMDILESSRTSIDSTFDLFENLLEWGRIQRGQMLYQPEQSNVKEVIEESIRFLTEKAQKKAIELISTVEDDIFVFVDRTMLLTILRNLISNAIKFTENNGKVTIHTSYISDQDESATPLLQVTVSDTGIGIRKEVINKMFDINHQITTAGTNQEKGVGLGLLLCKEFISKNNGKIWVESEQGKGSHFVFTLPLN